MNYEFDSAKSKSNLDKHGLSLADADGFEWETAVVREDTRKQYAEPVLKQGVYRQPSACDGVLPSW